MNTCVTDAAGGTLLTAVLVAHQSRFLAAAAKDGHASGQDNNTVCCTEYAGWQGAVNDRPTPSASGMAEVSQLEIRQPFRLFHIGRGPT